MKLKLYVSGPISLNETYPPGHPERKRNEDAFFDAEVALLERGHRVVNPMRLHVNHPDWSWERKLRLDIEEMVKCDAIFMLRGWNGSRGAILERHVAGNVGMGVFYKLEDVPIYVPVPVDTSDVK